MYVYKLLDLQRPVTTILLTIGFRHLIGSYQALVKAADETDTNEDLPKTKNVVIYVHSILVPMLIAKQP